ncbi:V-type proton ATPase catalytic subunit A isoform X2 [Lates japonicus]|uniref:V-type proton ATPase catalytic subunit A isoform X2 n=1 Tax=Lates japonicus TaxID=270547 RepID=A0AAD3NLG9_LATJO|nr:V-type proton ATPase catalytic subunit A isoform X2 [Lates japonicus]
MPPAAFLSEICIVRGALDRLAVPPALPWLCPAYQDQGGSCRRRTAQDCLSEVKDGESKIKAEYAQLLEDMQNGFRTLEE